MKSFELGPQSFLYQGKLIAAISDSSLDIYGGPVSRHEALVQANRLPESKVLGGARYSFYEGILSVFDTSSDYGSIAREAGEEITLALKEELTKKGLQITSTDLKDLKLPSRHARNASRWQGLGYII